MENRFLKGFVKAANAKKVTSEDFEILFKKAYSADMGGLSSKDIAHIRDALSQEGYQAPYGSADEEAHRQYNSQILQARDREVNSIPEVEALVHGGKKGLIAGGIGGVSGALAGKALQHSNLLNLPYTTRAKLPTALGTSAAVISAILSAIPNAKRKYDQVNSIKKLNNPNNMEQLIGNTELDRAMLNH